MRHYFCDLCKREVQGDDIAELLAISLEGHEVIDEYGEICDECRDKIAEFIESMKKGS